MAASKLEVVAFVTPMGWVAIAVPTTLARTWTPAPPEESDPEVNVVGAAPKARPVNVDEAEYTITGEIVSPEPVPVPLTIEKATGAPPTGRLFTSYTVAVKFENPTVEPTLLGITVGDACSKILAAVLAVIPTVRVSLKAELRGSSTWILATPAEVVDKVAVAIPATGVTVTAELVGPFQVPIVVAKVTLAVGAGAVTCTANESPIFIAVVLGLAGTTPVPPFNVSRLMPKVEVAAETVKPTDAVAPTPVALAVTEPTVVVPATEITSLPAESVVPVVGLNVTAPIPVWVSITVAPEIGLPPASFAVMVNVAGDAPLLGNDVPDEDNVSVEPTICIWSKAVGVPDVAVMFAVRLALLATPEVKVTVALPVASVVTVWVLSKPVSALRVTITPGTVELVALIAVTVIVLEVEPSVLIVVGEPDSWRLAAVVVVVVGVVGVVVELPEVQLTKTAITMANKNAVKNLSIFWLVKRSGIWISPFTATVKIVVLTYAYYG
jgi:hypothetical protein